MGVNDHFGLSDYPFALSSTPAHFFTEGEHQAVLLALLFALDRGDGLLKVTGRVGTGKTMICRMLHRLLEGRADVALVNGADGIADAVERMAARAFGLPAADAVEAIDALGRRLSDAHAAGRRSILLVDEAQALGARGLEALRLLAGFEGEHGQLLQIVLFGQPQLDRLLKQRSLSQIAQRVNFAFMLNPLPPHLIPEYVRHRLRTARRAGDTGEIFDGAALGQMARTSRGLPRLVHLIADKALLAAYGEGAARVTRRHVIAAAAEMRPNGAWLPLHLRRGPRRLLVGLMLSCGAFLSGIAFVWALGAYLP